MISEIELKKKIEETTKKLGDIFCVPEEHFEDALASLDVEVTSDKVVDRAVAGYDKRLNKITYFTGVGDDSEVESAIAEECTHFLRETLSSFYETEDSSSMAEFFGGLGRLLLTGKRDQCIVDTYGKLDDKQLVKARDELKFALGQLEEENRELQEG